ncbi:NADH-quinone oxidoreductase subunit NuoE [Acidocella sp.]|uniref:NADH-quinone oxidoreductase subunit NuoE n=1 Tax=Acidocella sp. TaxID=50710 RepID=UPI0026043A02|nr:NADH-quinone oxidoreductase subunit NuoE [Acidocella sp.]
MSSIQADPTSFAFTDENMDLVKKAIAKYPEGRQMSAVKTLLDIAQRQMAAQTGSAWLPRAAMDKVAEILGVAPIRVYEMATFYTMYNLRPVGKYHLQVCTTTPCWLRGSDDIVAACKKAAGVADFGETSADGLFTLREVECLGACVNAPILQINDDYYEDLDASRVEGLLGDLKAGKPPPPAGSLGGRTSTAPASGQTTLLSAPGSAE